MDKKHAAAWFEIAVSDYSRAKGYYQQILNTQLGETEVEGSKLALLPCEEGSDVVGGALIDSDGINPSTEGTVVYLDANPDLQAVLDRVIEAGSEVYIPKTEVGPDMGFFAQFKDSEGNRVGLFSQG